MKENNLVIGNWYTQYSTGYWQLIDLKPKYADEDYVGEKVSWKKGERLGNWAIVKKAFTAKMKKSICVECVDSSHLANVPDSIAAEINRFFDENPKYLKKYNESTNRPDPYITNIWLKLSENDANELISKIGMLPDKFTMAQLEEMLELDFDNATTIPGNGCSYLLNLLHMPWELTEEMDPIYCGAKLSKM